MIDTDYAYKDIEECEAMYGYKVGQVFKLGWDFARISHEYKNIEECEAFKLGWNMARTTKEHEKTLRELAENIATSRTL